MIKLTGSALRAQCEPVGADDDVTALIRGMFDVVDKKEGLGLAANQVGSTKQVIVVNFSGFRVAIINPVMERGWGGTATASEGSLSYPGRQVRLTRWKRIRVTGLTEDKKPVTYKPKGMVARIMQHGIDHMNGITIFERKKLGLFG